MTWPSTRASRIPPGALVAAVTFYPTINTTTEPRGGPDLTGPPLLFGNLLVELLHSRFMVPLHKCRPPKRTSREGTRRRANMYDDEDALWEEREELMEAEAEADGE